MFGYFDWVGLTLNLMLPVQILPAELHLSKKNRSHTEYKIQPKFTTRDMKYRVGLVV